MAELNAQTSELLNVDGLTYAASGKPILQPVSFTLERGELVGVIGTSGAGKSTLVKLCAGVLHPAEGQVLVEGQHVAQNRTAVAYVPQEDIIHKGLTVEEALTYGALIRLPEETTKDDVDLAVTRVIAEVELTPQRATIVGSLSGGQLKRVNVAMELLTWRPMIFLDEPTTGLDSALERRTMINLRQMADGGRGVMIVTHSTYSLKYCDAIIVLGNGGKLAYWGTLEGAMKAFGVDRPEAIYEVLEDGNGPSHVDRDPSRGERPSSKAKQEKREDNAGAVPGQKGEAGGGLCGSCGKSVGEDAAFCSHCGEPIIGVSAEVAVGDGVVVSRSSSFRQLGAVLGRGVKLLLRDRRNLLIMFGQVPVIAILITGLFASDVLERVGGEPGSALQLLFLLVSVTIYIGTFGTAREIVKESAIYERETAAGLRASIYLLGKFLIASAIVALQTILMFAIVIALRPIEEPTAVIALCMAILVLTGMVGVALGLLVSAAVSSEEQASSILPLVLIPQLIFAGAIVPVAAMSEPVASLSVLVFAQSAFAGLGEALDMAGRISDDRLFGLVTRYGSDFFAQPAGVSIAILGLFLTAFMVATWLVLRVRGK